MNILIDIGATNPSENDTLVYRNGKWEATSRQSAFAHEIARLNELADQLAETRALLEKAKADLATVASILKEEIAK